MKRCDFFKSLVGLIGVATSIKDLQLIDAPIVVSLPPNTRIGDVVMNKRHEIFLFDGKKLRDVTGRIPDKNAIIGNSTCNEFVTFSRACQEV